MISRLFAGTVLGLAVLALPSDAVGQQSAAVNVRIVVAPVDRLGFGEAPAGRETSNPVDVTETEVRAGGPSLPALEVRASAAGDRAELRQSGEERMTPCAQPAIARHAAAAPEVSVTYGVWKDPATPSAPPVPLVTCTLVAS